MKVIGFKQGDILDIYTVAESEESLSGYEIRVFRTPDRRKATHYYAWYIMLPDGPCSHADVPVGLLPFILEAVGGPVRCEGPFGEPQACRESERPFLRAARELNEDYLMEVVEEAIDQGMMLGAYHIAFEMLPTDPGWQPEIYEDRASTYQFTAPEVRFRLTLGRMFEQEEITHAILLEWERRLTAPAPPVGQARDLVSE